MKRHNVAWVFLGGIALGLSLALCVAAVEKKADRPTPDWSRLMLMSYPNGATGIFDPQTGRLYLYDASTERCYAIRELRALGESMVRILN